MTTKAAPVKRVGTVITLKCQVCDHSWSVDVSKKERLNEKAADLIFRYWSKKGYTAECPLSFLHHHFPRNF